MFQLVVSATFPAADVLVKSPPPMNKSLKMVSISVETKIASFGGAYVNLQEGANRGHLQ